MPMDVSSFREERVRVSLVPSPPWLSWKPCPHYSLTLGGWVSYCLGWNWMTGEFHRIEGRQVYGSFREALKGSADLMLEPVFQSRSRFREISPARANR